jgi:hypothetical protein
LDVAPVRHTENVTPRDTSPAASEFYFRRLAELTPVERINIAVALCNAAYALQRAALRHLHPDADEDEITYRIAVTRFGEELARKAYKR